jgi:FtsH-binding integral membrane protein
MEFFDRAQPELEKLFTMNHLKRDTRQHMKKVYSALTLTLLAAAGGAMLANFYPLLANPFLVLAGSLYLVFNLAGKQGSTRERMVKLILLGGLTGAGLRPLLNYTIMVNPNIIPTAFILTSSIFICFSLVSLLTEQRSLLYLGSMLASALSTMFWLSVVNLFIGSTGVNSVTLYGGVVVMSGFVCYDTQLIVARFEMGDRDFIYHSLDLFMDFISLFRKLLIILTKKEEGDRRRRR